MEMFDVIFTMVKPMYFVLAYAGMIIHEIVKMGELSRTPDFSINEYLKKNIFSLTASFLMIPVLLILASDSSIKDLLPLNNVTSVLAGWQTQSIFKSLMSMFGKKRLNNQTSDNSNA